MDPVVLGALVTATSFVLSGLALLARGPGRVSGALCAVGGGLLVVWAVLWPGPAEASFRLALAAVLVLALAAGCYPRVRWRSPLDVAALAVAAGTGAGACLTPHSWLGQVLGWTCGGVLVAHTWYRMETAAHLERRALTWMALSVCLSGLVYGLVLFGFEAGAVRTVPALAGGLFAVIGPSLYVGATLPEIVDVRGMVARALGAVVAFVTVMAAFVLGVALLDTADVAASNIGARAIVAGLAAVLFHPTQVLLRGVLDELLFGSRPDPLDAASTVAGRISADPVVALQAIREALVVPYAAVLVGGETLAVSGTETTHTRTRDLDGAGTLVLGLRPGDLSFSTGDEQVLRLVVPLLAQSLRSRALAEDLIESRGQTIAAVEEERRRLRRELHDGLGPRLSGVAFTSDAARNLIRTDPGAAEAMVTQLRADTVTAIEEIRRLVYAMRPPALDELGLVPALRQQATGLRSRTGSPVAVSVSAPEQMPELPAAVEVAAYRIVTEALTNVARHSDSPSAAVRLTPEAAGLRLEVTDRGAGPDDWRTGVGLASMRERAAELGGTLEAGPGPHGGRVAALLPLV